MGHQRRPKGSQQGGQFAPSLNPDEQTLLKPLSLEAPEPDHACRSSLMEAVRETPTQETRDFFDEWRYEASVGPTVERLLTRREDTRTMLREKIQGGVWQGETIARTVSVRCEIDAQSNELFAELDTCVKEGDHKERYAREALRRHGWRLRRFRTAPPYYPRGVSKSDCNKWISGEYRYGLLLKRIKDKPPPWVRETA